MEKDLLKQLRERVEATRSRLKREEETLADVQGMLRGGTNGIDNPTPR